MCLTGEDEEVQNVDCRDKDDLRILGLAKVEEPDYIITGDKDLLVLKQFEGIPIITPREFWEIEKINTSTNI
jgi:predicted nucleic acid-binding protein